MHSYVNSFYYIGEPSNATLTNPVFLMVTKKSSIASKTTFYFDKIDGFL